MSARKNNVIKNEEQHESEQEIQQQSPKMKTKVSDIPIADDGTTDIPPEPFCNLPVRNPYADETFIEFPKAFTDVYEDAPFQELTFEEWNEQQEPKFRIYTVSDFDMQTPDIIIGDVTQGSKLKPDGQTANFCFSKIKVSKGKGREESCMIQTPSMIAPGGYRKTDTGNGEVTSVKAIMDLNNPHHRQFWFGCLEPMLEKLAINMLTNPVPWGIDCPKTDPTSKNFEKNLEKARDGICKILRVPKVSKTEADNTSTKRIFYINPLDIPESKDKDGKKIPGNQARIFMPGDDEHPVSLATLENYCKGFFLKDGQVCRSKPKGFEFSAKLLVSRLMHTSKNSLQIKLASVYIHRFFNIERNNAFDKNHLSNLEGRINVDVDRYIGLENFRDEDEESAPSKSSKRGFNPMVSDETHNEEDDAPDMESLHESSSTPQASAPAEVPAPATSTTKSKFIPARKFTPVRKTVATEATAEDD